MGGAADRTAVVDVLVDQLRAYYVDTRVAERVVDVLRRRLAEGAYDGRDDAGFAEAVTVDTVAVSTDAHLRLRYSREPLPVLDTPEVPESGHDAAAVALDGHGFGRVERLPGNVGLVEILRFYPARIAGHAAAAAMTVVADTDALVVDLRRCPGGEPDMVTLVESYLVDERTQLTAIHFPREGRTVQSWTNPYVAGRRFGGTKPVYVLLSGDSYSAAEGFSYDLQQTGRATLVGERTPTGVSTFDYRYRVDDHLAFSVPSGYPVHPVSGRGWGPDGVQPDIHVPASRALDTAYGLALQHVLTLGSDGSRGTVAAEAADALRRLRSAAEDDAPVG